MEAKDEVVLVVSEGSQLLADEELLKEKWWVLAVYVILNGNKMYTIKLFKIVEINSHDASQSLQFSSQKLILNNYYLILFSK